MCAERITPTSYQNIILENPRVPGFQVAESHLKRANSSVGGEILSSREFSSFKASQANSATTENRRESLAFYKQRRGSRFTFGFWQLECSKHSMKLPIFLRCCAEEHATRENRGVWTAKRGSVNLRIVEFQAFTCMNPVRNCEFPALSALNPLLENSRASRPLASFSERAVQRQDLPIRIKNARK